MILKEEACLVSICFPPPALQLPARPYSANLLPLKNVCYLFYKQAHKMLVKGQFLIEPSIHGKFSVSKFCNYGTFVLVPGLTVIIFYYIKKEIENDQ